MSTWITHMLRCGLWKRHLNVRAIARTCGILVHRTHTRIKIMIVSKRERRRINYIWDFWSHFLYYDKGSREILLNFPPNCCWSRARVMHACVTKGKVCFFLSRLSRKLRAYSNRLATPQKGIRLCESRSWEKEGRCFCWLPLRKKSGSQQADEDEIFSTPKRKYIFKKRSSNMRAHNESGCLMWGSRWNEGICFDFWPILYEKGRKNFLVDFCSFMSCWPPLIEWGR